MSGTKPVWPTYSWRAKSANTRLVYIRDHQQADIELLSLRSPLGFDLEWRPNFVKGQLQNPVALVQLSDEDTILLIQITAMSEFPSKLIELLENPNIVKAGVGIQYDCKKLHADWNVAVRNCVDLSLLARCVDNARWKGRYTEPIGLARLVETYEEHSLPKGKVQKSNWEAPLSQVQQDYAANDAHSGLVLYSKFAKMAQAMDIIPDPVYYSFDAIEGLLYEPSGDPWCPDNPHYDPGPPPPPRPPKPPNSTLTQTPDSTPKPPFANHRMTESGQHRLEAFRGKANYLSYYSSPTLSTFDSGRRTSDVPNRSGHHSSSILRFNPGPSKPEIPSGGSHSFPTQFVPSHRMSEIPNGVNYNLSPPYWPDPFLNHGHKAPPDELGPPRPTKPRPYKRRYRKGGGRSGGGPSQGPSI